MSTLADQIASRAAAARERIAAAAVASGRAPESVTLVAVTKTHPMETVEAALEAGLTDLGENRVQELVEKATVHPGEPPRWHLIGSLQRNKARDVARLAHLVHSVDSVRLAEALAAKANEAGRRLPVLVQVNISDEATKGGVAPEAAHELMAAVVGLSDLRLDGLMGLAAPADDDADAEQTVRPAFRCLRTLFDTYNGPGRETISTVSMGMSGDYEMAVEEGSTLVRVGTALFGGR